MLEKLINYNFKIAGKLLIDKNNKVNYRINDQEFKSQNQEQVYAWVSDEKVLYIGMASKGIQKRLSEHRGGWRGGSSTGIYLFLILTFKFLINNPIINFVIFIN